MAEDTPSSYTSERQHSDNAPRGERPSGPREGGFRIRLSDNEMRSARALQEAFGLRSTVAVLGFALRTLGQQLEEGKLEELVSQHRAQMGSRGSGGGGRPEGRRERSEGRGSGGRWQESPGRGSRGGGRVDPFARPSRPVVAAEVEEQLPPEVLAPDFETEGHTDESAALSDTPASAADTDAPAPEGDPTPVLSDLPPEAPAE